MQRKEKLGDFGIALIKAAKGTKGIGWLQKQLDQFYYKSNTNNKRRKQNG